MFETLIFSPRRKLSLQKLLDLAAIYLESAKKARDPDIIFALCHDIATSLSIAKRAAKNNKDEIVSARIASIYGDLGRLLESRNHRSQAKTFLKKSEEWG